HGRHFGAKFTNTLIVGNNRGFFPSSEKEMYLSGAPLHVLAMNLVHRFRQTFGDRFPVSFSAGINARNFPDAVALGLTPITVCSDLLQPGGYGRTGAYYKDLARRMDETGAVTVDDFVLRAYGNAMAALDAEGIEGSAREACIAALEPQANLDQAVPDHALAQRWLSRVKVLNTATYVEQVTADPRYALPANSKPPKKVGSSLVLLDCLTCDKCLPVCPNDANFTFVLPRGEVPVLKLRREAKGWATETAAPIKVAKKHQIGNFADFCNECGNCDVFCPEDGGPYVIKPRFFGSRDDFQLLADHDGFYIEKRGPARTVLGRFEGRGFEARIDGTRVEFSGTGFAVEFDPSDPAHTIQGTADGEVDLTYYHLMDMVSEAVLGAADNYVSAAATE
ncbi:MAG: 4Fe-4S dicluster domain-containing protein, partial [Nannocystaceae bacterium]